MLGQYVTQMNANLYFRKPRFLMRTIYYLLLNIIFRERRAIRSAVIMFNAECNCRCEHCFSGTFQPIDHNTRVLQPEEYKAALNEMVEAGVFHFVLHGGEPFLNPNLNDYIKACQPQKSYLTIVTNGTIADKDRLREVHQLGVDKIGVSIDSIYPEEHDSFRNLKGCHEMAFKTLEMAKEVGMERGMSITFMNENLHTPSIQELIKYCEENEINIDVNIPQPVGKWEERKDLMLTDENFKYIEDLHKKNIRIRRDIFSRFQRTGCPAASETLYLNNFGEVLPCAFLHTSLGNIRDYELKDILCNAMKFKPLYDYVPKCLVGESPEFMEKYLFKVIGAPKPVDGLKLYGLGKPKPRTKKLTPDH